LRDVGTEFGEFASLVMDGRGLRSTLPKSVSLFEQDPKLSEVARTYRYRAALVELDMIYYSERPLRSTR